MLITAFFVEIYILFKDSWCLGVSTSTGNVFTWHILLQIIFLYCISEKIVSKQYYLCTCGVYGYLWCTFGVFVLTCVCICFCLYVFVWWAWKNKRKLLTHTYSRHSSHVSWKKTQQILTQQLIHFTLNFILSKIIISSIFLRTKAAHHSADCNVPNKNLAKMLSKENQNCYKLGRHMSYIFGHFQQWFYQIRDEQCMYLFTS